MEHILVLSNSPSNLFMIEDVIDVYESLIWTIRYKEAGEFEFYTPATLDYINKLVVGKFLFHKMFLNKEENTAHLMVIETVELDDIHIKVTGRSLRSILDRRVVWKVKAEEAGGKVSWKDRIFEKDANIVESIRTVLNDNIISPDNDKRRIPNFIFDNNGITTFKYLKIQEVDATHPTYHKELIDTTTIQEAISYDGATLLDVMTDISTKYHFAYEVLADFTNSGFILRIIKPEDHSYESQNPIVFASKFNNLQSSNYIESSTTFKNVAMVNGYQYGDDELFQHWQYVDLGDEEGLNRRELFVDATDIPYIDEGGTEHGRTKYYELLKSRGREELAKKSSQYSKTYEGEADIFVDGFIFNEDYKIGDTVEIINKWGMSSQVRVTEMVLSISKNGITAIPTFEADKEEEE